MSADNVNGMANPGPADKLVATVVELRATVRSGFYFMGFGFLLVAVLLTFVVSEVFRTSARIDRLNDRIDRLERPRDNRPERPRLMGQGQSSEPSSANRVVR